MSHETREGWLITATNLLRPMFAEHGATVPDKIRFSVAFPSAGAKGSAIGECWQATASADYHYTIIIRADRYDSVDVLAILVHELVHACLPAGTGHGRPFRKLALAMGLEGKMTATHAGADLTARLKALVELPELGEIPHGKLSFAASGRKKQTARMFKAACPECGYLVYITRIWAEQALPTCPLDDGHGRLVCKAIDDEEAE